MAKGIWIGVAILVAASMWGLATLAGGRWSATVLFTPPAPARWTPWPPVDAALLVLGALAFALPAIGGGEPLSRLAHELAPPRLQALRRTSTGVLLFTGLVTALGTLTFILLVPSNEQHLWVSAPLVGMVHHAAGPDWLRNAVGLAVAAATVLVLAPAIQVGLGDLQSLLHRLSTEGMLPLRLTQLHRRFGTPAHIIDLAAASSIATLLVAAGRVEWLGRAYGLAVLVMLLLNIAALVRLRERNPGAPYRAPLQLRYRGRDLPLGLVGSGILLAVTGAAALVRGDLPSIAAVTMVAVLALVFQVTGHPVEPRDAETTEGLELLPPAEVSLDAIEARPGSVLVPVRNPHALHHVAAALRAAGDRDVVVMTARLDEADAVEQRALTPTANERRLFAEIVGVAERLRRPVRLLIVPGRSAIDAIVSTVLRLRCSDVYVGESSTLSAQDQARLLGEAWERADKPEPIDLRLAIVHGSGRTDTFHIGAHPPSLSPGDLDLIHRLWLDAVKAVGPHVHHHDVVRAALTQMEQQMTGVDRDAALAAIRETARPADELAALLRAQDYARLRDLLRNRHAGGRRRAAGGPEHRRSSGRVPRVAAQGRRRRLRVPDAGRQGSASSKRWRRRTWRRCSTTWRPTSGRCSSRSCRRR